MKALLVRIAVDRTYGEWNAPVDPSSNRFVYVSIPEEDEVRFHPGLERRYDAFLPALAGFCRDGGHRLREDLLFPDDLMKSAVHLDPDFSRLTYGDVGNRRGARMKDMSEGDLLVFYSGLRPTAPCGHKTLYALVGLYVVEEVVMADDVPPERWDENAHTRRSARGTPDIIIRAKRGVSGRLDRCIPIGEWRDRAYRVRRELLDCWGGLTVTNGYIQRSAVPPCFLDAERFYDWFRHQGVRLVPDNN